jgi:hypothetical protein
MEEFKKCNLKVKQKQSLLSLKRPFLGPYPAPEE